MGPPDGRYLVRGSADAPVEAVLALRTLGAPQRRLIRGRRGRSMTDADAEPVATARATVIRPGPFDSASEAEGWLRELRGDRDRALDIVEQAARVLDRALHAHRTAAADPYVASVSPDTALVCRVGFGDGEQVADGRFEQAWELPRGRSRTRRSMEAPEQRFAALLGGRELAWPCEELVLRARLDLQADRGREAALQARVALESLLAELSADAVGRAELEEDRERVAAAANEALRGGLSPDALEAVEATVSRMETALRRKRLRG